ncbi:MAG: hypothetical protein GTO63_19135 [Anaerolineae bacterium]|nr:hypothetical protein [Anaerolineae bacterium]NIN96890.1 hypothetical protein [Anaerolineae bacterium]NIQ82744.1 hypothetical protein [Anaerolineae bacterium]
MIQQTDNNLLLACVRARWSTQAADEVRRIVLETDVNWDGFLEQAAKHCVAPLIYHTMRDEHGILPASVKQKLREEYYLSAVRNTLLYQELANILATFNDAGLPVIVLKGAALAQEMYGNIALRPMSDIDLLVKGEEIASGQQLLLQRGYSPIELAHPTGRHSTFEGDAAGYRVHIEVHSHIVSSAYYRSTIPEDWLWRDPVRLPVGDNPALMLSPEGIVVHSCLHLLDHVAVPGSLLWLCDIKEVSQRHDIAWDAFVDNLVHFRIASPVRSVLFECSRLLRLPIPERPRERLLAHQPGFWERRAYQLCLSPTRSTVSRTLFDLLAIEGVPAKAHYLHSRLLPDRDYMMARYSIGDPRLVPLYYPLMITRAIADGLKALAQPRL